MSDDNSITVALRPPIAPRGQASTSRQQEDSDTIFDLTKLPKPTEAPNAEQQSLKPYYNLSPDALSGYQNQVERRGPRRFGRAQPSPLAPQHGSRVAKVAHLSRQAPSQPNTLRSNQFRRLAGSSANNPIAIDDQLAINQVSNTNNQFITNQYPRSNNTNDSKWCYKAFQAFDPRDSIPPFNQDLVKLKPPPPSPSNMHDPGACFLFQVDVARHLAFTGVNGPYEIGGFLCDIHKANGGFVKIARRETAPNGEHFWRHIVTGDRLQPQDGSDVAGKPIAYRNGALFGMQDDQGKTVSPEWTFTDPRGWQSDEEPWGEAEAGSDQPGLKPDCNPMWP
ncbi:hypothetical protein NW762_006837 [Fusarium torreyae]|uniref:Uncharacterized protein n=1 Tax=Fusarium torreyae TaxID=1237075 RepID=A0A9W8RZN0_9HYPO|nr:hypothetical protein NW762_006837 [Fusarium torreyae]